MKYFYNNEQNSLGLHVTGCGKSLNKKPKATPRTFDSFALVYLNNGAGYFKSQNIKKTLIKKGDLFILFPNEEHEYGPEENQFWDESWILFEGIYPSFLKENKFISPNTAIYHKVNPIIQSLINKALLYEENQQNDSIPSIVFQILTLITKSTLIPDIQFDYISAISTAIKNNPLQEINFENVAQNAGVSYSLFRKNFRLQNKVPPLHFLNRERMKLACQHLSAGHSVKETAIKIGMDDPYHFSRLFKKIISKPPSEFIRHYKLWQN